MKMKEKKVKPTSASNLKKKVKEPIKTPKKKAKPILVSNLKEKPKEPFSPIEYIKKHPANPTVVESVKSQLLAYIEGYCDAQNILFVTKEWYVGISNDPDNSRTAGHKNRKKLTELVAFKSFFANSMPNARAVEEILCGQMGHSHCAVMGGISDKSKWCYTYHLAASPSK